jgi:hypothetical protein
MGFIPRIRLCRNLQVIRREHQELIVIPTRDMAARDPTWKLLSEPQKALAITGGVP